MSAGSATRWAGRNPLNMFSYNTMALSRDALLVTYRSLQSLKRPEACRQIPSTFPLEKLVPRIMSARSTAARGPSLFLSRSRARSGSNTGISMDFR